MKSPLRLLLPLLLLAGGAFTVALGGFYESTCDNLRREALARQQLHAKAVAHPYLSALNAAEALGNAVAALVGPGTGRAEVERVLESLLSVAPCEDVRGVGVWLENMGAEPLSLYAQREGKGQQVRVEALPTPPGARGVRPPWVEQARAANGAPVFLPPIPVNNLHRVYALGVRDNQGQLVGAVAVDLGLEALARTLEEPFVQDKQVAYVTAPTGVLLLHPFMKEVERSARGHAAPITAEDVHRYQQERSGSVWREAMLPLRETGWAVHLATEPGALFGNVRRFQVAVALLGLTFWGVLLSVPLVVHQGVRSNMLARALEERRRIHTVLEHSEHRMREVLETSLDAVVATDAGGHIITWNQQAERTFGFPRDEVLGRPLLDVWGEPGTEGAGMRGLLKPHEGGPPRERISLTLRRRSGESFPVELSATCVRTHDTPACYFFLADVTHRRRAEEERQSLVSQLQRRSAELRATLDNMVDSVVVSDVDGHITLINRAGRRLFGAPGGEVEGPSFEGPPRHLEELPLSPALRGQVVMDAGLSFTPPGQHRVLHVRTNAAPIRTEEGRIVGAVAVARDVTERVELEQLKEEFVRVAAHELKTPVAIMKTNAQLALRLSSSGPPTFQRMLEAINRGADRIDGIVRELLDVSQLQLGQLQLREEPVDLSALVKESAGHAATLYPGRSVEVSPGPSFTVRGDRHRLAQVLAVLLDNALRYSTPSGRVEVHLEGREGSVEVCVRDEGIGIPRGKQHHLFERFYRAHSGTPHDRGGLGVGLYIAREIITQHGGQMRVRSEEGQGSMFCFSLPFA